jgi:hypothetical protein
VADGHNVNGVGVVFLCMLQMPGASHRRVDPRSLARNTTISPATRTDLAILASDDRVFIGLGSATDLDIPNHTLLSPSSAQFVGRSSQPTPVSSRQCSGAGVRAYHHMWHLRYVGGVVEVKSLLGLW